MAGRRTKHAMGRALKMADMEESAKISDLADKLDTTFAKYGQRLKTASNATKGVLILFGTCLAGVGQFLPDAMHGKEIGLIGVALALFGGIWAMFLDESAPNVLMQAREAIREAERISHVADEKDEENEVLLETIEEISMLYVTQSTIREFIERAAVAGLCDVSAAIQSMLTLVRRQLYYTMDLGNAEYFTIAVYQYEKTDQGAEHLVYRAGLRPLGDDGSPHRTWGVGEGVAGHCYRRRKEIIIENINNGDADLLHVPEHLAKPDDATKFVSFGAIPIVVPHSDQLWGVLVVTSDEEQRFEKRGPAGINAEIEPARMLAGMIALLVAVAHVSKPLPGDAGDGK